MDPLRTGCVADEDCDIGVPLQMYQTQMRELLRHFSNDVEGQMHRQRYMIEKLLSEQSATLREHFDKHKLRGADAEGDGGSRSRVSSSHTDSTAPMVGLTKTPSPTPSPVPRASITGSSSSWASITRFKAREKRLTAAAYKDAQEVVGDTLNMPPFLVERVNSAKSWHTWLSEKSKENCAERLVHSRFFQCFSSLLIIANAVYIGSVADRDVSAAVHDAQHGTSRRAELKEMLFSVDVFFTIAFSLEQLFRIVALRWKFFIGRGWRWNLFDITVVLSSVVELVFQSGEMDVSFVRLVRLLRVLRAIQVIRRMTFFRKMRLMLLAILDSILALFWAVLALLFITFFFAVLFLQGVAQQVAEGSPNDSHLSVLSTFYRSLPMTSLTLWMCASGGIDLWKLEEVWLDIAPGYAVLLLSYQVLMVLAFLNIVTGIFVHDSIEAAQNDRDVKASSERERKVMFMKCATRIFEEMDTDHTMILSLEQFQQQLQRPVVRHLLRTIDMDVSDAIKVFEALDVDGNRALEIDEFVVGCAAIQGPARALDVEALKVQMRRILFKLMGIEKILQQAARSDRYNDSNLFSQSEAASCDRPGYGLMASETALASPDVQDEGLSDSKLQPELGSHIKL